jgi:hypothetical protein
LLNLCPFHLTTISQCPLLQLQWACCCSLIKQKNGDWIPCSFSLVNLLCLLQIWTPVRCSWVGHFPILAQSMALWQSLIGAGIAYMVGFHTKVSQVWRSFLFRMYTIAGQWIVDNLWTVANWLILSEYLDKYQLISCNSTVEKQLVLTWSYQILCWDTSSSSLTCGHLQEVDTQGLTGHWSSDHCISRFEHEVCFMLVRDKSFPGCLDENHQNFQILLREYWIVQKCCECKFTC